MSPIRCVSRTLRLAARPSFSRPQASPLRRRCFADKSRSSPTRYEPDIDATADNVQNEFAGHAMSAFRDMRKVILFLAYGGLIVTSVTGVIFEAAHFWIEGQMREGADDDAKRWGWEVESWSDAETGGTSPALGIAGRHAVRAAWFSLRYGKYYTTTATISQVGGSRVDHGNLNMVDASLESARVYLEQAMARVRDDQGHVRMDSVGLDLLERHASVMERLGTQFALIKARNEYIQLFHGRTGNPAATARLAVKIGDVSERLGDDSALVWWTRGIDLVMETKPITPTSSKTSAAESSRGSLPARDKKPTTSGESLSMTPVLPTQPPSSPAAQRTLVAAMLSLSAYYSKRKQLHEAQNVQEYAIQLIDAMVPQPEPSSLSNRVAHSPGQTLHHMYLLHRKSLLGIHHGEVTFALASSTKAGSSPHAAALTDLLTAASSSEVVAQLLAGLSLSHPDLPSTYVDPKIDSASAAQPSPHIPHPPSSNSPLLPAYGDSPALSVPAASVLRDARLAAAEAWDLCGILYSDMGGVEENVKALECFERALGWVGEDPTQNGSREGIGEKEWQALWARFVGARDKVLKKSS